MSRREWRGIKAAGADLTLVDFAQPPSIQIRWMEIKQPLALQPVSADARNPRLHPVPLPLRLHLGGGGGMLVAIAPDLSRHSG